MNGYINSIETLGLADGPGVRTIIFFQGCDLRCFYCHNPETWQKSVGTQKSIEELVEKVGKYKNYYGKRGGVTISGGEPLLQGEFLLNLLKELKAKNYHICLDTAGFGNCEELYDEILSLVDIVLLDVKHFKDEQYYFCTGQKMSKVEKFIERLNESKCNIWVRHVVVPGYTDNDQHISELRKYISKIKRVQRVDLLPFHTMGKEKYDKLGIDYRAKDIEPMCGNKCAQLLEQHFEMEEANV